MPTLLALSRDVIDIKLDDEKNTIVVSVPPAVGVAVFSRKNDAGVEVELYAPHIDPASLILRGADGATWAFPVKQNARCRGEARRKTRS